MKRSPSREERAESLVTVAVHEAGHALVASLEHLALEEWSVIAPKMIVRRNRSNVRHCLEFKEGWVTPVLYEQCFNLPVALAGIAAEGHEVFLPPAVRNLHAIEEGFGSGSDEWYAWKTVELAHLRIDGNIRPARIADCINEAYRREMVLFGRSDYMDAIEALAIYMIDRGHERDPRILQRFIAQLNRNGFTPRVMNAMRNALRGLNLPGVILTAVHPHARMKKSPQQAPHSPWVTYDDVRTAFTI